MTYEPWPNREQHERDGVDAAGNDFFRRAHMLNDRAVEVLGGFKTDQQGISGVHGDFCDVDRKGGIVSQIPFHSPTVQSLLALGVGTPDQLPLADVTFKAVLAARGIEPELVEVRTGQFPSCLVFDVYWTDAQVPRS